MDRRLVNPCHCFHLFSLHVNMARYGINMHQHVQLQHESRAELLRNASNTDGRRLLHRLKQRLEAMCDSFYSLSVV